MTRKKDKTFPPLPDSVEIGKPAPQEPPVKPLDSPGPPPPPPPPR